MARAGGADPGRRLRLGGGRPGDAATTSPPSRRRSSWSRSPAEEGGQVVVVGRRRRGGPAGAAPRPTRPGPDIVHSVRSNQCEPRSASTTRGSVCRLKKTCRSTSAQISTSSRLTSGIFISASAGQLGLADGQVLELEVGRDLHQLGPVGTASGSSSSCYFGSGADLLQRPGAVEEHRPARVLARIDRRTGPRRRASGRDGGRSRSPSSNRSRNRPSASGGRSTVEPQHALAGRSRPSRARRCPARPQRAGDRPRP